MANFLSKWDTTITEAGSSNSDQISLPIVIGGTYNFEVFWGDGSSDVITNYSDAAKLHTYASGGIYDVIISGTCIGWNHSYKNGILHSLLDRNKIIEISQWGDLEITNGYLAFRCHNLDIPATDAPTISTTTFLAIFNDANSLTSLDLSNWNVSGVTNMGAAFAICKNLVDLDVSTWDVSNVTNMQVMFAFSDSLTSLDVSNWDVSNVTNMDRMFQECNALTTIYGIGNWDVSNVTEFNSIFENTPLTVSTYNSILDKNTGWISRGVNNNLTFNANISSWTCDSAANDGRDDLIALGWNITDLNCIVAPPPFCSLDTPYIISGSSGCNVNDGKLLIPDIDTYQYFYNFELTDVNGNVIASDIDGNYTSLPTGWYFFTATPITSYLRDTCTFDWIEIEQLNGALGISGTTISDAICGSFNQQAGRAVIELSGLTGDWFAIIYKSNKEFIGFFDQTTGNPIIAKNLIGDTYYVYIYDYQVSGCRLTYSFTIKEEKIYSVPNIKEIYVSEWDENVDWNYWSTENDPDYFGGLDTLKFQSTKIKEFLNTNQWYFIPVDEQNVSFDQSLQKVRQGFIFTDTLTITFAVYDKSHWQTMKDVLNKKYVVVFKDNNDNWWVFGFKHGAETKGYSFGSEDAGLRFTFSSHSENKIITALNDNYIQTNIL